MRFLIIILAAISMACLTGCGVFSSATEQAKAYTGADLHLASDAKKLDQATETIDKTSKNTEVLRASTVVKSVATELKKKDNVAKALQQSHDALQKENTELKSSKQKRVDNFFFCGIVAGGVMVAASIILFVAANASGVVTLTGLAIQMFIAGLGIMLASGVMFVFFFWGVMILGVVLLGWLIMLIFKIYKDGKSFMELSGSVSGDNNSFSKRTQTLLEKFQKKQQPKTETATNGC